MNKVKTFGFRKICDCFDEDCHDMTNVGAMNCYVFDGYVQNGYCPMLPLSYYTQNKKN